jgi:hypothetical protein
MKRLTLRISIALLTFAIGLSVSVVFWMMREPVSIPSPLESAVLPVDYLELSFEPERYAGRRIRVRLYMHADWTGSVMKGYLGDPHSPWDAPFFGFDYAPDSEESFIKARGILGVDPNDPVGEFNVVRSSYATLEGDFVRDRNKTDYSGRKFPYWFIVRRLEQVEPRR